MSNLNTYLPQEAAVVDSFLSYPAVTEASVTGYTKAQVDAGIDVLLAAIRKEGTDATDHRGFLDEMSPACRVSLYRALLDLKDSFGA